MDNMKAIEILADSIIEACEKYTSNLPYDITFSSMIYEVGEDDTYIIKKDGNEYSIKNGMDTPLSAGQTVWVKIPCNNMNHMHICGFA